MVPENPTPIDADNSNAGQSRVAILLCTYQGQNYLSEQLESFAAQTHPHWDVWASDDGSEDDTRAILEAYQQRWPVGRLSIHSGPAKGFALNFLSLTCNQKIEADYYAYSDQDDIWEADKLERALKWLQTVPESVPALYCSRTRLVDENNKEIGFSPLHEKAPCFANALIQNIGGGNTMVFNNAARELLRKSRNMRMVTHDWWAYMVVSGCGGEVFYDRYPSVRYRQHKTNQVGYRLTWLSSIEHIKRLWDGTFNEWNETNISALHEIKEYITNSNLIILEKFAVARNDRLIRRIIGLKLCGIYRQTLPGNLGMILAALFKKF